MPTSTERQRGRQADKHMPEATLLATQKSVKYKYEPVPQLCANRNWQSDCRCFALAADGDSVPRNSRSRGVTPYHVPDCRPGRPARRRAQLALVQNATVIKGPFLCFLSRPRIRKTRLGQSTLEETWMITRIAQLERATPYWTIRNWGTLRTSWRND